MPCRPVRVPPPRSASPMRTGPPSPRLNFGTLRPGFRLAPRPSTFSVRPGTVQGSPASVPCLALLSPGLAPPSPAVTPLWVCSRTCWLPLHSRLPPGPEVASAPCHGTLAVALHSCCLRLCHPASSLLPILPLHCPLVPPSLSTKSPPPHSLDSPSALHD